MASGNCRADPASAPTNGRRRQRRPPSRVEEEQHPQLFQVTPRWRRQGGGGGGGGYRSSGPGRGILSTTLLVVTVVIMISSTGSNSGSLRVVNVSASPVGCGTAPAAAAAAAAACVATTTTGTGRHPCGETGTATFRSSNRSCILESMTSLPPLPMGTDDTYEREPPPPPPPPRAVAARTFRQLWDRYGCDKDVVVDDNDVDNDDDNDDDETYRRVRDAYDSSSSRGDEDVALAHGEDWGPPPRQQPKHHRRPIPDADTWTYLRAAYNRFVRGHLCDPDDDVRFGNHNRTVPRRCYVEGVDVSTVSDDDDDHDDDAYRENDVYRPEEDRTSTHDGPPSQVKSGFKVPVEVRYSPGKGRGVFATTHISEGTLVWVARYEGRMTSGDAYRHLLDSLPINAIRCEVMTFTYYTIYGHDDDDASTASEVEDGHSKGDAEEDKEDSAASNSDAASDSTDVEKHVTIQASEIVENTPGSVYIGEDNQVDSDVLFDDEEWEEEEGGEEWEEDEDNEEVWADGDDDDEDDDEWWWEGGDEGEWDEEEGESPSERSLHKNIFVSLDEAALMNADWESPDRRQNVNVGSRLHTADEGEGGGLVVEDEEDGEQWTQYVALRDIQAGEEILCAYDDFVTDDAGWAHFGL